MARTAITTLGLHLSLFLCAPSPGVAQQAPVDAESASTAVRRLAERVAAGDARAEAAFWARIEREGAPLVEPADDPGHSIVTFVYRDEPVRLVSNLSGALEVEGIEFEPDRWGIMSRLPGTGVWYRSYRLRNDIRVPYWFEPHPPSRVGSTEEGAGPAEDDEPATRRLIDPSNPRVYRPDSDCCRASVLELPDAPARRWIEERTDVPEGDWREYEIAGRALPGAHTFWVYSPADYDENRAEPYPIFLGLGAAGFGLGMPTNRILDNLTAAGRIEPTLLVLADDLYGAHDSLGYEPAARYVVDELLPRVRELYAATSDPREIVVSGTSRRGLVSAYIAWSRPDAIANVLSLSGSFYWTPESSARYEWLTGRIADSPRRDIRLYLAVGELETVVTPTNHGHYMLSTNRHARDVLTARGYDVRYVEFNGVHHSVSWQDWIAPGLLYLWGTDR